VLATVTALWAGCGRVRFVPSPYSPQSVEVTFAPAEDLSVVRFAVAAPDAQDDEDLTFELAQPDGTFARIDFGAAPYPSGGYSCPQGTCFQLVRRGRYQPTPGSAPVRAQHARVGLALGGVVTLRQVDPSLTVSAGFAEGNATLNFTVDDRLLGGPLPRALAQAFFAHDQGDCDGTLPADSGPAQAGANMLRVPAPLTDVGRYCLAVHGVPRDGGPAPPVTALALTWPETVRAERRWRPPVEQTPLLVQIMLDLETADSARCADVHAALLGTLRGALGAADGGWHEFPLADLAPTCHQDPSRRLDAPAIADAIKQYVHQQVSAVHNRVVLFYANNLGTAVPQPLGDDLAGLPQQFANDARIATFYWGMVADGAVPTVAFDLAIPWTAIEDPGFARALGDPVSQNLPFQTELSDAQTVVSLLDSDTLMREAGGWLKLCQDSPPVELVGGAVPAEDLAIPIRVDDPPGFLVDLPPQITVPRSLFEPDEVFLRWEICRRFCDHPFENDAGLSAPSWRMSPECVHNRVP
jgi:hypothetical protein